MSDERTDASGGEPSAGGEPSTGDVPATGDLTPPGAAPATGYVSPSGDEPGSGGAVPETAGPSVGGTPPAGTEQQPGGRRTSVFVAPLLVLIISFSMQTGSALATKLIEGVGVIQALWLRTAIAAVILVAVRPRSLRLPAMGERWPLALLTVALFGMNLSFYGAIANAPLGIVVTIEFLGPLAVAVAGSRRPLDYVWVALAAAGVVLLAGPTGSVGLLGIGLSLSAAFWWALYLVFGRRAVRSLDPLQVTTWMLVGSTMLVTPLLAIGGFDTSDPRLTFGLGAAVAVLSSAFPYFLELVALRLVRASLYSVLLSLEPALAALTGYLLLGQALTPVEILAMGLVVVAAAGASWHHARMAAAMPPAP
jgi:inner membrane transporter RhtA